MDQTESKQSVHSVYIHIPFCSSICSYCDFCKVIYHPLWISPYLDCLEAEIKTYYQQEKIQTIYIGGGTPSCLSNEEWNRLFSILALFNLEKSCEFTVECNTCDIELEKMTNMFQHGVNRISIGVETSHSHLLKKMNRSSDHNVIDQINVLKKIGFTNINVDFMYALPGETLTDVKDDLEFFLTLNIPHISLYSLMIEPHTKFYLEHIEPISEDMDFDMYQAITKTLMNMGYQHYEISNYSLPGYESKHNMVYWNNEGYYGFGLGSSGYLGNIRYQNTKSMTSYLKGQMRLEECVILKNEEIENELMLGLRKMEGINIIHFEQKYGILLEQQLPIISLLKKGRLIKENGYIKIHPEELYVSNDILVDLIGETYE